MGLERPGLGSQTRTHALGLDLCREGFRFTPARLEPQPHDPDRAAALEGADVTECEVEGRRSERIQRPDDTVDDLTLHAADEADGEVQVGRRRPAKLRRDLEASGDVSVEDLSLRFRHRQPEERPNSQRSFFVQCDGAQMLG